MVDQQYTLAYPRKRLARFLIRLLGRVILPLFFEIEISGTENFPTKGPLLVVGNHTAAMEAVMLNIYSRRPIEMLSAADTPAERIIEIISNIYGVIPLHRGSYDRAALTQALDILKQDGYIGLFPEGGIWEEGKKKALPGISWLSEKSRSPVLPIGFNDTSGALAAGLQFKRPKLTMRVGQIISPAQIPQDKSRKEYLQEYADQVMEAVHQLVPQDQYTTEPEIVNERFELALTVEDQDQNPVPIPDHLIIHNALPLAKFFHRPPILKIFQVNLDLPVEPLQNLLARPSAEDLLRACQVVVTYLDEENPYLLTYRFGVMEGQAMKTGLQELVRLLDWCQSNGFQIQIDPVRTYFSIKQGQDIRQVEQGHHRSWM